MGNENKESGVDSPLVLERNMTIYITDSDCLIKYLLPYLELRQHVAIKYFKCSDSELKELLLKQVGHININIKEILGL